MRLLLLAALLASFTTATRAQAPALTAAQRDAVVQTMREALKADPSILRDALKAMEADDNRQAAQAAQDAIASQRAALFANPADPAVGSPKPAVTVVEFYDTRCPYCRSMLPTLAALLHDDPTVRIVYKDIPILGPASVLEAKAVLAAQRQGAYLPMQDALMHQAAPSTPASIDTVATRLGLDPARLDKDMADPATADRLQANLELAKALHVDGTPALVIGDQMLPGEVDLAALKDAVAAARPR